MVTSELKLVGQVGANGIEPKNTLHLHRLTNSMYNLITEYIKDFYFILILNFYKEIES